MERTYMSAFDQKQLSGEDAFRLAEAKKEEANAYVNEVKSAVPDAFEAEPVAQVVEQIMSHWADVDDGLVREVARASGDPMLQRLAGQKQSNDLRPSEGISGDFKADSEGPAAGIDVPPHTDIGDLGHGVGDAGVADAPGWGFEGPDGLPLFAEPGAASVVHGGGGGGGGGGASGEGDNPLGPPKPPKDPKKPKKP